MLNELKELLVNGMIPSAGAEPAIITFSLVATIGILWVIGKWAEVKDDQ